MDFGKIVYTHKKIALIVVIAIGIAGLGYYWHDNSKEFVVLTDAQLEELGSAKAVAKYYERLQKAYDNDTFGGSTPEETLSLFVEALESGEVELASKYFVFEKQEVQLKKLSEKTSDGLKEKAEQIRGYDFEETDSNSNTDNRVSYYYYSYLDKPTPLVDESGKVIATIPAGRISHAVIFVKYKVWKIEDL
ncbi:MAG: hypothetical protein JKX80_01660 [Candidatus Pacebacteria bacterium]|nr:hypothetical protein [Candidatus Paceibacterota bacterium]